MRKVKFLLGLGISFAIVMVALEAFVRFTGTSTPMILMDDDNFGKIMKPDMEVVFLNEGFCLGRINTYSCLGPEYAPSKPEGVTRIALIGDSYVAGHQLFDRHHFRRILEDGLNGGSGRHVQVLNLGFPAINFEQMYLYYEVFARKFSPDFVIYVVGASSLNLPSDEIGPRVVVDGDSLSIDYAFRGGGRYEFSRRISPIKSLALYPLVRKVKQINDAGKSADVLFDKFYRLLRPQAPPGNGERQQEEKPKRMPINRGIVKKLGEMNRAGSPTSIIMGRDGLPETFVDFVRENGVIYFDPSARLDSLVEAGIDPKFWPGSQRKGHWNQYAHEVIGAFLIEKMTPLLRND